MADASNYTITRFAPGPYEQKRPIYTFPGLLPFHAVDGNLKIGKVQSDNLGAAQVSPAKDVAVTISTSDLDTPTANSYERLRSEPNVWEKSKQLYTSRAANPARIYTFGSIKGLFNFFAGSRFANAGSGYPLSLDALLTESQKFDVGAFALKKLETLYQALSECPDAIFTSKEGITELVSEYFSAGILPPMMYHPAFNHPVLTYRGVPVLRDDGVPSGGSPTSYTYFYGVVFGWGRGLIAYYPEQTGLIQVERVVQAGNQGSAPYEQEGYRISLNCQTALFRDQAVARIDIELP